MLNFLRELFLFIEVLFVPPVLLAWAVAGLVWALRVLRKPTGSRLTVRGMLITVAIFGCWFGTVRLWVRHNFATVYATGYDEGLFRRVKIGMTSKEVESILGCPIRKESASNHYGWGDEKWIYSDPPPPGTIGDNYWRRWVIFKGGKVAAIVDDYYED